MPPNEPNWINIVVGIAAVLGTFAASWFATKLARKSQREANALTADNIAIQAEDLRFKQSSMLLQDVQEERTTAVQKASSLETKVEAMDQFMRKHFAGYRAYIHELRGQIYDLGGTPKAWPPDLEQ